MNPVFLELETVMLCTWLRCCMSVCVKFAYCGEMCSGIKDMIGCNLC